ncbi:atp-dependent rna helicase ddx11-like protein 8-like [Lichtheimia corymbifera JMRC:FSU:9682]|uniref:ATP-dependent DNA helicase CHL1 n=1 Tax=Lichtheimia corymbifera JMRC:FSU:9682 TaxID=1263082 RepID=A0A068RH68_9FUNG|nr:atp-dependent rna helicase ddx11-like protein 8-like [Lichtheimia corymbifera JMRC:FSU:9682]
MEHIDFQFPYTPYAIQNEFMAALYETLSAGKIGIFESPTGTGKSLSLICGSLRWLKDQESQGAQQSVAKKVNEDDDNDEPDWLRQFQVTNRVEQQQQELIKERRQALRERIRHIRQGSTRANQSSSAQELARKRPRKASSAPKKSQGHGDDDDDEFLLDEYESDQEQSSTKDDKSNLSKEVRELLAKMEESKNQTTQEDPVEEEDFGPIKIYYASRTHSQLSQFVREVHKTSYADDLWSISLGSRKNMCIHKDIRKLKSVQRINDACLDLQKKNTDKARCPHLLPKTDKFHWDEFRDHALAHVRDIEDLVKMGEQMGTCPYYGSRHSLRPAELVVLPYQHLLHASTRESLGISLKDSIVIIDEAHNVIETVTAIHTVALTLNQIRTALSQLTMYMQRYRARLLGKNVAYIKQVMAIVKALIRILQPKPDQKKDRVLGVNEFVHLLSIDHMNMFKIEKYLKESRLAQKLNGFIDKQQQQQQQREKDTPTSVVPTLTQIEAFILTLTNPDKDGRIVLTFGDDTPQVKYMLLNPADVFEPIVRDAKSIILAGGTMEPVSDFTNFLFNGVPAERIRHLSCGHIIPSNQMAVMTIDLGPTGKPFLFNFESRKDERLMDELGLALVNLSNVIPDGVVCFFPSFTYLQQVYRRWADRDILERLSKKKKVFKEPRESNQVEVVLREYAMQIDQIGGALLLCVVNGKMSEGINFSDRLGRGVIMVGLPFANAGSAELQEKIKYARQKGEIFSSSADAGKEYYENMCMRGVNQSIGRAIRHKNDYATIILLDQRYTTPRISNKLPKWIGDRVERYDKFGKAMGGITRFFRQFPHPPPPSITQAKT